MPHVQHDYFSSWFNQSNHWFVALSLKLPLSNLKLPVVVQRTARLKCRTCSTHYFFPHSNDQFLICGVVLVVDVVFSKAPNRPFSLVDFVFPTIMWRYSGEYFLSKLDIFMLARGLLMNTTKVQTIFFQSWTLGSFSNDDGDGKKNFT